MSHLSRQPGQDAGAHAMNAARRSVHTVVGMPYLTFSTTGTTYALSIIGTQAIIESHRMASQADLPDFVRGVHDWHGIRLPVIDLSARLGFTQVKHPRNAVIVVAELWTERGGFLVGVEVSNVREVLFLKQNELDVPDASTNMHSAFIDALSKVQDHFVMVVHPSQLLTPEETDSLAEIALSQAHSQAIKLAH